jgi:hypothetical protein
MTSNVPASSWKALHLLANWGPAPSGPAQARGCFQFLWSGTSDPGAVYCTPALGNYA